MVGSNVLQAVTLLSQSISVAASVVEAVKTCGDSAQQQGEFASPKVPHCPGRVPTLAQAIHCRTVHREQALVPGG